jgi:hypothetical protein
MVASERQRSALPLRLRTQEALGPVRYAAASRGQKEADSSSKQCFTHADLRLVMRGTRLNRRAFGCLSDRKHTLKGRDRHPYADLYFEQLKTTTNVRNANAIAIAAIPQKRILMTNQSDPITSGGSDTHFLW